MTKSFSGENGRSPFGAEIRLAGFMIICHAIAAASSEAVVAKCCPPGQIMPISHDFLCAQSSGFNQELYPLSRALRENFTCSDSANLTVTALVDTTEISAPAACLDFMYDGTNIPVIFQCLPNDESDDDNSASNNATLKIPRLANLTFCCGPMKMYDLKKRECVRRKRDFNVAEYFNFLDSSLDFVTVGRGPPKCQHALVDYVVNVTKNVPRVLSDGSLELVASTKDGLTTIVANEKNSCLDPGDEKPDLMVLRVCSGPTFCKENKCVRKCCQEGEAFVNDTCAKIPSNVRKVNFHDALIDASVQMGLSQSVEYFNTTDYGLLVGRPCKNSMYMIFPDEDWHMNPHGHVYVPTYRFYETHDYCAEIFYTPSDPKGTFYPSVCFENSDHEDDSMIRFRVNAALELISCAFLVVTLLVYICLPVLQNLHGKTLMCHVASLIVAYSSTAAVALNIFENSNSLERRTASVCQFLGYAVLLSWVAAFSWLNVMCFDIWWTFGGLGGAAASGGRSRAYRKRFLMYSLYAWGSSILITGIGLSFDLTEAIPLAMRPNVGTDICWFEQRTYYYGEFIFFRVPVTLQLITNVVFFVLTAIHCSRVKAEISRVMSSATDQRNRRFQGDRTKLIMNVKLFIVMGVTWTLEVVSAVVNHFAPHLSWRNELFYVADVFNSLQGVLIFMLFVLKSKVYYALRRRLVGRTIPTSKGGTGLQDPYRVRKSASSSTIMSTFAVSTSP